MEQRRLLIIEDNIAFAEFLRSFVEEQPDLSVISVAARGEEGIDIALDKSPDAIIVDLSLPGISGLETIRRLREACVSCRIVATSVWGSETYVTAALSQGADAFVAKTALGKELMPTLRRLLDIAEPERNGDRNLA